MDQLRDQWIGKLEHLHRAAVAVAGAHSIEEALQTIADAACELTGASISAIGVPGEPGQPMAHFVVSGLAEDEIARAGRPPMGRGVLGVLLQEGRPVMADDLSRHPAFEGLPSHHPPITSFLGVPVQSGGEVIGDLYLANRIGGEPFREEDRRLAEMFAAHAAVVIQNLRYHRKNEELAVVRARARLAPLIEDDVFQKLYGAGLLLNTLNGQDAPSSGEVIREVQSLLDAAIVHLREHLLDLAGQPHGEDA
jgi:GAF domain-containing protein